MEFKISVTTLKYFALAVLVFGIYALNTGGSLTGGSVIWLLALAIGVGCGFLIVLIMKKMIFDKILIVYLLFLIVAYLSRYWATVYYMASAGFNSQMLTYFMLLSVTIMITNRQDCMFFIKVIGIVGFLTFFYYGLTKGFVNIINIRETGAEEITDINANSLGMKYIISALCCQITARNQEKKNMKLLYSGIMVILIGLAVLTGSRKVLIMIMIIFAFPFIWEKKNMKLFYIVVSLMIAYLGYVICISVPFLYDLVGCRIEETLGIFNSSGVSENSSTGIRMGMADLGLRLFKEKPILGYGMANACYYNGVYLHNNYLELLVGVGIVGTFFYYLYIIIPLFKLIIMRINTQDYMALRFITVLICQLIIDFFMVSYNTRFYQIFILFISRYIAISNRERRELKTNST